MNSLFASYEGLMQKAARQSHLTPIAEDALAEARLSEAGVYGKQRKAALDSVAAQEILQDYLDQHATTRSQ